MEPWRRRWVTVEGQELAFVEAGSGEAVVFLHGYPQTHLAWRHQLEALSQDYRVIAPDWFGWGDSGWSPGWSMDYEAEVRRLAGFLDALDVSQVNLVVHDYGGYLGLSYVAAAPDRVKRLAVLNTRGPETFPGQWFWIFAAACALARLPLLGKSFALMPLAWLHRQGLRGQLKRRAFDEALLGEYLRRMSTRRGRRYLRALLASYSMRPRLGVLDALESYEGPVSVIWGWYDAWCPPSTARALTRAMPKARMYLLDGDHFIMEERPVAVTQALRGLLARPAVELAPGQLVLEGVGELPAPGARRRSEHYRGAMMQAGALVLGSAMVIGGGLVGHKRAGGRALMAAGALGVAAGISGRGKGFMGLVGATTAGLSAAKLAGQREPDRRGLSALGIAVGLGAAAWSMWFG